MITPGGCNTFLRTCDADDPKQWFLLPPDGTEGQIHPYRSSKCLTGQRLAELDGPHLMRAAHPGGPATCLNGAASMT